VNLYEINASIQELVNKVDENGEICFDPQELIDLEMAKEEKIENTALLIKNLKSESKAIADEVKSLNARKTVIDNQVERVLKFLDTALAGEKFSTAKAAISFRSTPSIEVDDEFVAWAQVNASDLLRYKAPEADKTKIKEWLRNGIEVDHAREVVNRSVVIR